MINILPINFMSLEQQINKLDNNTLKLFEAIQEEKLSYVYRGKFTSGFTKNIISLAQCNIMDGQTPNDLNRKVYHVMVEGIQNISRHQASYDNSDIESYGLFAIKKENSSYFLTTGNLIENENIDNLTGKINKVNNLGKDQLKKYHKEVLWNGKISEKGGAGLGLIDIARRAGSKINYFFTELSNNLSFFYLQTEIVASKPEENALRINDMDSLLNISNLHPLLSQDHVFIVFSNSFSQENLLDLLTFLENQMADNNKLKRQIFNVMVELFQNITKHASEYLITEEGKRGIFYISENENEFILTTGNYILSDEVQRLKDHIIYLNGLDQEMLKKFYSKRLFDFEINTNKSAGLGLIDLRIKSDNQLAFDFQEINKEQYFYTLKVKISKQP